jgi:T-complex protein 1 subunit theta
MVSICTYGAAGMNKMVINHIDKLFVTSDAFTVIREVEVNHPAARMIALAAKM